MASENVKIVIQEQDNTKPGGAGIAPSDIVFIPGFSVKTDAPQNIPTLCSDVYEFEKAFGTTPRVLTSRDVEGYDKYGFIAGQFDKSYIYAKELLYLGMPVVYSNIVSEGDNRFDAPNVDTVAFEPAEESNHKSEEYFQLGTYNDETGSITLTALQGFTGDETVAFTIDVTADGVSTDAPNLPVVTTFEVESILDSKSLKTASIKDVVITAVYEGESQVYTFEKSNPIVIGTVTVTRLSDNQIEFTNVASKTDLKVKVCVTLDIDLDVKTDNNKINVELRSPNASCLDVFYKSSVGSEESDNIFDQLTLISDKSVYSVKYITSGGYPSVVCALKEDGEVNELSAKTAFAHDMLRAAADRGDAVALIDYQMAVDEKPFSTDEDSGSFYAKMHKQFNDVSNAEYGAMMYPWGQYTCGATLGRINGLESTDVYMPGSFAYMKCMAKAIKTSPNWLAMAGVSRGIVPGLNMIMTPNNVLSNTLAEEMQPKFGVENHRLSINCITNIRPYGLTLWGNRTLKPVNKEGCVALNFLNTRNMLSDIKKVLYSTAKSLMFEQNSDTLWLRFKAGITPLLNQLKSGNGISDYKIVKGTTKYNGDPLQKGELAAVIKIYPMYAVEYFELTVELNDEEVTVS